MVMLITHSTPFYLETNRTVKDNVFWLIVVTVSITNSMVVLYGRNHTKTDNGNVPTNEAVRKNRSGGFEISNIGRVNKYNTLWKKKQIVKHYIK